MGAGKAEEDLVMAKILVIDDRPVNREFLVTLLSYAGHQVLEAGEGAEGLAAVRANRPDLVITDILMPTMDGVEFAAKLRAEPGCEGIPVIFYTATYRVRDAKLLAASCGVKHVLSKPCEPELILRTVNEVLGRAATRQRLVSENSEQSRLAALLELHLDLAVEREVQPLLDTFCRAAKAIMDTDYAGIGVYGDNGQTLSGFSIQGASLEARDFSGWGAGLFALLPEAHSVRLDDLRGRLPAVGLPASHPPIRTFLGVRIATNRRVYGWIYFGDKTGERDFTVADERVARTLASQVATVYENLILLEDQARRTEELDLEVKKRRRAQEELQRLNSELEQRVDRRTAQLKATVEELEAFSYSVSHDLRAPLRALVGYSQILVEDSGDILGEEGKRQLNVITSEAGRMGQLIDDLLDFSRFGRLPLEARIIDVADVAKRVFESLTADKMKTAPRFVLGPLPQVQADRAMLRQVFVNLLGNAIKFSSPKPEPTIEVEGHEERYQNIYCVRDNGVGFDERYKAKLFSVFQRLHSEAEFEGTGIGLALVQRIIHRHGGRVWAEGRLNEGACFHFSLPRTEDA